MNNDISDVNNFTKAATHKRSFTSSEVVPAAPSEETVDISEQNKTYASSMDCLGTLGCAQVNMNNPLTKRIKASVESYGNDPVFASEHVNLCDELVKRGYPLERAINTADIFFETLKKQDTYK